MPTFSDMKTYVSKRLLDRNGTAVSIEDVGEAVNDAISYWKFRRFWFNEVYDTATLTAQNPNIPLPNDFLVPSTDNNGFNIQYSNIIYPLVKVTQSQFDGVFLQNGYGRPTWYARVGQDYKCYPIPDRAYDIGRHYLKDYVALVNDGDTNDFTDNASRLINLWALANLSGELRQDDKMETYYRSAAQNEYTNLLVMTSKSNASGKLSVTSL